MNNIIKNIKKFSTFTIAFTLLASQLTACGKSAQSETTEADESEIITIEVSTPLAEEKQGTENELTWVELALLETNPEIRSSWESTLGITGTGSAKAGMLYVNAEGTQEPNNTLSVALSNEAFRNALTDSATSEALINAVMDYYEDVEDGEDEEALMMGINAYFNLLPDSADNYANAYSPLTRSEFMALVMRSDTAVDDELTVDQDFRAAIGSSKYDRYAQEVADNSYLDIASGSLNEDTYNSTITRAEAVYIIVSRYFSDELAAVDISNAETYSDVTNAGNIAEERGYSEYSQSRAAELEYMLENPEEGMTEELYKAMVVAYDKGLLGDDEESRWDEGITKVEAVSLVVNANLASESAFDSDGVEPVNDTGNGTEEETGGLVEGVDYEITEYETPVTMYATVTTIINVEPLYNVETCYGALEIGNSIEIIGETEYDGEAWYVTEERRFIAYDDLSLEALTDKSDNASMASGTITVEEGGYTDPADDVVEETEQEATVVEDTSTSSSTDTTTDTSTSTDTSASTSTSTDTSSSTSSSSSSTSSARYDTVEEYYNWIASTFPTWDAATIQKAAEEQYQIDHSTGWNYEGGWAD